jgi:hypothetical protein
MAGFEKMEILEDKAILDTYYMLGVLYKQRFRLAEAVVLLDKGAIVNVASKDGWTPLHSASNNGHVEVIKVVLS